MIAIQLNTIRFSTILKFYTFLLALERKSMFILESGSAKTENSAGQSSGKVKSHGCSH